MGAGQRAPLPPAPRGQPHPANPLAANRLQPVTLPPPVKGFEI